MKLQPSPTTCLHVQNEEDIAAALRAGDIPRRDVFITSKVSPYEQGTAKASLACTQILQRLQTDYVVRATAGCTGEQPLFMCHGYEA